MATKQIPTYFSNARQMTARECALVRAFTDGTRQVLKPTRNWIIFYDGAGVTTIACPCSGGGYNTFHVTDIIG